MYCVGMESLRQLLAKFHLTMQLCETLNQNSSLLRGCNAGATSLLSVGSSQYLLGDKMVLVAANSSSHAPLSFWWPVKNQNGEFLLISCQELWSLQPLGVFISSLLSSGWLKWMRNTLLSVLIQNQTLTENWTLYFTALTFWKYRFTVASMSWLTDRCAHFLFCL